MTDPLTASAAARLADYDNPQSPGSRFRAKRIGPLLQLIRDAYALNGHVRILDIGGRKSYWNILPTGFLEHHKVSVTILNIRGELRGTDDEVFTHVFGDGCNLVGYSDRAFHIAHSNSVIEHVGGWQNVRQFAREMRRVASGLFVQTPYYWFPIEPHYMAPLIHWLPRPLQEAMVRLFPLGYSGKREPDWESAILCIDATRLLDLKAFRLLFPDCQIVKERFFLLTKSLIAVRPVA